MANGHGGPRPNSGRKPGTIVQWTPRHEASLATATKATAEQVLSLQNEFQLWAKFLHHKNPRIALAALIYLTNKRDGEPFKAVNPGAGQPNTGKLSPAMLQSLLPQPGTASITLTEKRMEIGPAKHAPQLTGNSRSANTPTNLETGTCEDGPVEP